MNLTRRKPEVRKIGCCCCYCSLRDCGCEPWVTVVEEVVQVGAEGIGSDGVEALCVLYATLSQAKAEVVWGEGSVCTRWVHTDTCFVDNFNKLA
jgi:hypothetical protein